MCAFYARFHLHLFSLLCFWSACSFYVFIYLYWLHFESTHSISFISFNKNELNLIKKILIVLGIYELIDKQLVSFLWTEQLKKYFRMKKIITYFDLLKSINISISWKISNFSPNLHIENKENFLTELDFGLFVSTALNSFSI